MDKANPVSQPLEPAAPVQAVKRHRRRQPLTLKQRKLIRSMSQGAGITKAARTAGYSSPQSAQSSFSRLRRRFSQLLDHEGLTEKYIVRNCLKPGLKARETIFAQKDGLFTDERSQPDWTSRHRYLETVLKLKGVLGNDVEGHGSGNTMVMVLDWRTEETQGEPSVIVPESIDVTPIDSAE